MKAQQSILRPNSREMQKVPFTKQPNRLNVLFLGDGYTDAEYDRFLADVDYAERALLTQTPYREYASSFAFRTYLERSGASGATHPICADPNGYYSSNSESGPDPLNHNGTINYPAAPIYTSKYCYFPNADYVLGPATFSVPLNHAEAVFPGADIVIVLVNDIRYGGLELGNIVFVAAHTRQFPFIITHETGHAFDLDDEYSSAGSAYAPCNDKQQPVQPPGNNGPCAANTTNVVEKFAPPFIVKWRPWYAILNSGVRNPPYPGAENRGDYYRSSADCRMRSASTPSSGSVVLNDQAYTIPFCAVCRQEIVRHFYDKAGFVDGSAPHAGNVKGAVGVPGTYSGAFIQPLGGLSFEWRVNGVTQPNATGPAFTFVPPAAGNYTLTVTANDRTRDSNNVPFTLDSMVYHVQGLTWKVSAPAIARATSGIDTSSVTQTASITIPRGSAGDLALEYDVATEEPGGRPGDDWSVVVSIANSTALPLAQKQGTATNMAPVHGVQTLKVDASKSDVVVNVTVRVQNSESASFASTHITASLESTGSDCGVQCDPCLGTPAPSYCPANVAITSAVLLPIGGFGDNSYFSLTEGDRWIDTPRTANLKISPDYSAIKTVRFIIDILRPDGSVIETLRDATWSGNLTTPPTSGIGYITGSKTWVLDVTSQRKEMDSSIPAADKQPTPPILSNAQKSHEIAFNIRAIITLTDGRVGEVTTKLDHISSGSWLGDTHLVDRPLHALWRERATNSRWWYWDSLATHLWIEQHAGLRLGPDVFADEHAAFDTRDDHQWGTTFSEVPQYPVMSQGGTYGVYDDFRAQMARLLPGSKATPAQQNVARDFAATFIAKSRAHLDALISEDAVRGVWYANGSMCSSATAPDALPDRWLESLVKSGQVKAADGTTLINLTGDTRVGTDPWANGGNGRIVFTCDANNQPDVALDRCRLGETPPPCNVGRGRTNLTVSPVIASVGLPATFSANLSSDNGPVAGEELIFSLNNVEIGHSRSGADGTAILSDVVDLQPDTYLNAIAVTYAGGVLPAKTVTATLKALCSAQSYTIQPQALNVLPSGGHFDVFVNASSHCQWTPIANATEHDNPFLQVGPTSTRTGKGTFNISIPGNDQSGARSSHVEVGQQFVSVDQGGTASGCTYRFVPEIAFISAESGSADLIMPVTAAADCHWTASADPSTPWIHFNQQDSTAWSGSGNGQIHFSVESNPGTQKREAIVLLSDGTTAVAKGFVNQLAPLPAVCPITFVEDLHDGSVEKGQNIPLRVYTTGTRLKYQWYVNDFLVRECQDCPTMTLGYFTESYPAPGQSTTFQVRVSNSCDTAFSKRVSWQNNATPGQCTVPAVEDSLRRPNQTPSDSISPSRGALVSLSVTAAYATLPVTYTWYRGLPGDRSSKIATNPDDGLQDHVSVNPFDTSFYWVELTDACGSQQSRSAAVFTTLPPGRRRPSSKDFTGDGKSDLAWHNTATGQNEVWQMNGTTHASTIPLPANQDHNAQLQNTGDLNADGNTDIVWRDPQTGHNEVWLMSRTQLSEVRPIESRSDAHWTIGAVADYDNDNNDDIAWHNSATGQNEIWFNTGTDHAGTWALPSNTGAQWGLYGTGDFNNDEKPDLFFHDRTTGENQIWLMDDAALATIASKRVITSKAVGANSLQHLKVTTKSLPAMADTNWVPALVADMDGDGRPDIVWRNVVTGENSVWIMSGTQMTQTIALEPRTDLDWQIGGGGSSTDGSSSGGGPASHGPTALRVVVDPAAAGDPTAVTATLTASGAPVAQRQLLFTVSGTEVARLVTDATGSATAVIHTDARPAGTYPNAVSVRFEGDDTYAASSQSADLVITSAEASVTWKNPDAIIYGTPLSATLLNAIASVPGTFVYSPPAGAVLNAGYQTLSVTFTPNDSTIVPIMKTAVVFVVKAPSTVSWAALSSIPYGTPLSALQLNATSSVPGRFIYDPEPGAILPVANAQTLHVMFEPDSANYAVATATTTIDVTKGNQTILWNDPAPITTIQPLGPAQLNARVIPSGATPIGQMTYAPPLGTVLAPGLQELSLTVDATPYYEAASATVDIIVTRVTPIVQWAQPAPVVYGTPLSSGQLNATADVQGTFTYDPPPGTILNAGTVQLYLVFTPSDARYEPVSASVSFQIAKAKQVITWSNPAPIVYGKLLSDTQLNAQVQAAGPSFAGIVTYSPPAGTILQSGPAQTLTATVDATVNYDAATASVVIDVLRATPVISWQQPGPIVYGTPLGATQLGATADAGGTFNYTPPSGTILNVGTGQTLTVHFTPADTRNYNNSDAARTIDVVKAKQIIHWAPPAPIVYGTPLSSAQLNASIEVAGQSSAGVLTYTPAAGTLLQSGPAQTLTVTAASTGNYEAATASVTIDVLKATPVITWLQPAPIVYGTPLSPAQLNASVSVVGPAPAGALTYTPPAGTLLQAGSGQTLTVVAAETPNYAAATARVLLTVQKAKPVLTWANPAGIVYGTALSNTQLNATANVPGSFVFTPSAGTILNAGAGQALTVVFTPSDTNNYENGSATVTIDVAKAKQTLSWTLPSAIVYGTALSPTQLNASVKVAGPASAGALVYAPAAGTVLDAGGGRALSVAAQATQNYDSATLAVSIDVNRAPLSLTVAAKSKLYGAAVPLLTGTLTGVVNGDIITPSYAITATQQSPVGAYQITGTLVDPASRLGNYNVTIISSTLTVGPAPLQIAANAATKQYSDPLPPFSATFTGLVLGQTPSVLTGALTFTTPVTLTTAPGTYSLAVGGVSSPNYTIVFAAGTLIVTAEDARAYYTGAMAAMPLTSKATTVAVTLSATIKDISATPEANGDTSKGDIRNATATFVDRGNGATLCTAPIGLVNAADLTAGTLTCTATVTVSTAATQQLRVGVVVGKDYVRDAASDDTVVTIAKFATASVQGNGKLALTKPAGAFGAAGWDATFTLNASTTSSGDDHEDSGNPKFTLDLKKHGEDDDHGHLYRITATSLRNLVINNTTHTGTLDVAAVIEDRTGDNKVVLDSDAVVHVTFTAKSDNNNDGNGNNNNGNNNSNGSIAVTIWNKKGGLWFVSYFDGTKAVEQNLTDGDLKIH